MAIFFFTWWFQGLPPRSAVHPMRVSANVDVFKLSFSLPISYDTYWIMTIHKQLYFLLKHGYYLLHLISLCVQCENLWFNFLLAYIFFGPNICLLSFSPWLLHYLAYSSECEVLSSIWSVLNAYWEGFGPGNLTLGHWYDGGHRFGPGNLTLSPGLILQD